MLASLLFSRNFFLEVEAKPDLYGPFWLSTTCVFLMAMVAAELSYLGQRRGAASVAFDSGAWTFEATTVGTCASILYGYVFLIGGLLWVHLAVINRAQIGLFSLWCIYGANTLVGRVGRFRMSEQARHRCRARPAVLPTIPLCPSTPSALHPSPSGYSMTIWIPVALLSTIPGSLLSWLLVSGATLYSGVFLVLNLRQPVQESLSTSVQQGVTLLVVFAFHLVTGMLLKLLVFRYNFDGHYALSPTPPPPPVVG